MPIIKNTLSDYDYGNISFELTPIAFENFLAEIEKPARIVPAIAKLLTHKAPWDNLPTEESQTPDLSLHPHFFNQELN